MAIRLLRRPKPYENESLASYIMRLAIENSCRIYWLISEFHLQNLMNSNWPRTRTMELISNAVDLPIHEIVKLTLRRYSDETIHYNEELLTKVIIHYWYFIRHWMERVRIASYSKTIIKQKKDETEDVITNDIVSFILDLNGDGKMEVSIKSNYYEGISMDIYSNVNRIYEKGNLLFVRNIKEFIYLPLGYRSSTFCLRSRETFIMEKSELNTFEKQVFALIYEGSSVAVFVQWV